MPIGLKLQRKHRAVGYRIKYFYYFLMRREILQKRVSYGEKNKHKIIYVIKPDFQDGVEGLMSLLSRQLVYLNYAEKKNYQPYIDWKNYNTQYSNGTENAWEYFFEKVSDIDEKDVYSSKNVIISGWTFNDINVEGLFDAQVFKDKKILKKSNLIVKQYLKFNSEVQQKVLYESDRLKINECIGVYLRGTDYVKLKPSGEYIQPSVEQVEQKIKDFVNKYNTRKVYLVTEDGSIYDALKLEFGEMIRVVSFDTFIRNYSGNDVLSKSGVLADDAKKRGQEYLVKMILLSQCRFLISSITQGSKFSYILNGGEYEDEYIFDMGLY